MNQTYLQANYQQGTVKYTMNQTGPQANYQQEQLNRQ